jgi:hypothetical protein
MWFRAADKKHGKAIPATPTCTFIQTFTILHDSEIRCRTWVHCFISILVKRIQFIVHAWIHLEKSYFLETLHQTHPGSAMPIISNKTRHWIAICMDAQCATTMQCVSVSIPRHHQHREKLWPSFYAPFLFCIHHLQTSVLKLQIYHAAFLTNSHG